MLKMIACEFLKIKRYNVLWFAIFSVIFSTILAGYQSGQYSSFEDYSNNVLWNNFSLFFPFTIVLIGCYLINREYTDNTLKNIVCVPISLKKFFFSKLCTTAILTIFFSLLSFICTVVIGIIVLHTTKITSMVILLSLIQIIILGICIFLSVSPLIILFTRKQGHFFIGTSFAFFFGFCGIFVAGRSLTDFYPITAGLGIIRYSGQEGTYHPFIGMFVLLIVSIITLFLLFYTPNFDQLMAPVTIQKKYKK